MVDETIGYSVKLLDAVAKLKDKETGCDVELVSSDGTSFFVHRIIFAACSERLQSLLYKRDQKRKLILHDMDSVGLEAVVNYVYTGKVDFTAFTKSTIRKRILPAFESLGILDACGICKQRLNVKEEDSKSDAKTPVKRKRGKKEEMEMDVGDDLAYVDDEMDEDFVPPNKRHSPRRSLKPSSGVSMKRSEESSTPKPATVQVVAENSEEADVYVDDYIENLDNGKHRCTKCDSEFPKIKSARHHVRYICGFTDKKYKCQICGKGFAVMRYVTDHERRTHGHHRSQDMNLCSGDSNEKRLECQLCYTLFESKETIASHLSEIHHLDEATLKRILEELGPDDVAVPPLKEASSSKQPSRSVEVRARRVAVREGIADKSRRYGCQHCEARFEIKRYLRDHIRRVHKIKGKTRKSVVKNIIELTATEGLSADDHKQADGSYKCPDCGFKFEISEKFDEHRGLDTVNGTFECPCESCKELFNCFTLWEQHQLWHHDSSQKYQCVKCGLLFVRAIKNHVRQCKLESNGFSCEKCEVNFKTLQLRRNHCCKNSAKPIVASVKPAMIYKYSCGACGRGFPQLVDVIKHKYRGKCKQPIELGKKPNIRRCKYKGCKRIFHHDKSYKKHRRLCLKADSIMCDICGQVVQINRIVAHKKKHQEYKCDACHKLFKTSKGYTTHVGNGSFQCDLCGHVSACEGGHRAHLVFHGGHKKYTCQCGLKFKNANVMEKHKEKCTATEETAKLYQCVECGTEFKSISSLKSHSFIHTNPSKYQCPFCQRCFGTASAFYSHKRNVHKDLTHECPMCKKNFLSLIKLNEHHDRVHKGITHKFACDKCGATFHGEYKYGKHMRDMHGESIFKCPNCGQGFGYKSHLKDHIDRCMGKMKMVQCEICNKTMQRTTYREHIKVHVTPKRFICSKCGRGFDHKWLVSNHACKDAGIYTCTVCGQKQKTIHGYRLHMNQHVKDQDQTVKRQRLVKMDGGVVSSGSEPRAIEAFMGPDGQIYLPEGTVLAEGEELILDTAQNEGKPIFVKNEFEEVGMEDEIELIQSIKDENTGTELVLSGAQGDERYIVQVIDEEQVEGDNVTVNSDVTQAPPIEAQDVRYVHLPDGESVIQISIDGNTTLMLPCDKN